MNIKLVFESFDLNELGGIVDRSIFDDMKALIKNEFDGKTCIAGDDPEIEIFNQLHEKHIIDLKVMEMVSQEKFAEAIHTILTGFLTEKDLTSTVILRTVEVREHQGDSAIYLN
jgi:6-pyruvoyltetrahydropterin/6-carboxytetrahydropterin synthase